MTVLVAEEQAKIDRDMLSVASNAPACANGALRRIDRVGLSMTPLRLSGRRWPVAVARAPDGAVIVAVVVLDDLRRPQACLISLGAGG